MTNYKKLSTEMDEIIAKLGSSDLDVDEALKAYERGMEIAKEMEKYLKTAKNKITTYAPHQSKSGKAEL